MGITYTSAYKEQGSTIEKWLFAFSPAPADSADNDIFYLLGNFNKSTYRFEPEFSEPRRFDFGNNVFTGPSAIIDPVSNKVFVFSIMQDQRKPIDQYRSGWAHCVGLAREVYLTDDGTDACIKPIDALENYETDVLLDETNLTLTQANERLANVKGDMLHVEVSITNVSSNNFGIKLRKSDDGREYTNYYYNVTNQRLGVKTGLAGNQNTSGNFYDSYTLKDNKLEMEFYLDRSLIEGFFDDYKAVTARVYPIDKTSKGIELYADGGTINIDSIKVSVMKSIYK